MSSSVNGSTDQTEQSEFAAKLHEASRSAQFYMFPAIPASFLVIKVGQVARANLFERINIQDMGRDDILRTSVILAAGSSLYFYWSPLLSLAEKVPFIKNWKKPPKPAEGNTPLADDKKTETGDKKTKAGDKKTETDDKKSEASDKKTEIDDKKTETDDKKSEASDKKTEIDDKKSEARDKKSEARDKKTGASERKRSSHKPKENQDVQPIHPGHFMVTMLCRFAMLSTAFGTPVAIAQIEDRNYRLLTCGLVGITHIAVYRMTVKKDNKDASQTKPPVGQAAVPPIEQK